MESLAQHTTYSNSLLLLVTSASLLALVCTYSFTTSTMRFVVSQAAREERPGPISVTNGQVATAATELCTMQQGEAISTEDDWKCDRALIEVEVQDAGNVPITDMHGGGAGPIIHNAEEICEDTSIHTAYVDDEPLFRPIKPEPECIDNAGAVPPHFISTEVVSKDDGSSTSIEATGELEIKSTVPDEEEGTSVDDGESVPCASNVSPCLKRLMTMESTSCQNTTDTAKRTRLEKEFENSDPVLGDKGEDVAEPVIIANVDSNGKWVELVSYSNKEIILTRWSLLAVWQSVQVGFCRIKEGVKLPPHGKIKITFDLPVRHDSVNLSLLDHSQEERSIISYAPVEVTNVE